MKHGKALLRCLGNLAALAGVYALGGCDSAPNGTRVAIYPDLSKALQRPSAVLDYQNTINPATNIRTSGPYDWEDLYRGQNGFPLPGDAQIR